MISALRSRNFRLLWLSQSVSVIGDALVIVAVGLYVTRLTGKPSDVGLVLASYALPMVALVLIGGVIADRLPRRMVMIITDVTRAILHGTLAMLIATNMVRVWHMCLIGVLFGTAEAFFRPAYTGWCRRRFPSRTFKGRKLSAASATNWRHSPAQRWPRCSCSASAARPPLRWTPRRSWSSPSC